jgi:hypothetical protein
MSYAIKDKDAHVYIGWANRKGEFNLARQNKAKLWKTYRGALTALEYLKAETTAANILEVVEIVEIETA